MGASTSGPASSNRAGHVRRSRRIQWAARERTTAVCLAYDLLDAVGAEVQQAHGCTIGWDSSAHILYLWRVGMGGEHARPVAIGKPLALAYRLSAGDRACVLASLDELACVRYDPELAARIARAVRVCAAQMAQTDAEAVCAVDLGTGTNHYIIAGQADQQDAPCVAALCPMVDVS